MRRLVKWNVVVLVLAAGLACTTGAYADTLSWSVSGDGVLGSGTFTATNEGGGEYLVTGMTGNLTITYDGITSGGAITSFTAYTGTPGTNAVDPSGFYDYDDLVFPNSNPELDLWGVVFSVAGITDPLNLCGGTGCDSGTPPYVLWTVNTAGPSNNLGYASNYNAYQVNFSDSVPEASTMGLLSVGLLGLMFMRCRERRASS
jgi:hypothetical protein